MKRIFTICFLMFIGSLLHSQTPITINASDMPVPEGLYNFKNLLNLAPAPVPQKNGTWDYGQIEGEDTLVLGYYKETLPVFIDEGVDVYQSGFKALTQTLGYNVFYEIDFNDTAVLDKMMYIDNQAYGLGALTGNNKDSLTIPLQGWQWGSPRKIIQFPFTDNSSWQSVSYRKTNFNLTVTAAALNKAPGVQSYYLVRLDTIVGYGKMRLHTPNGPSKYYDVLVDQSSQFAIDSFFLFGQPAPAVLLNAFGITQGQVTGVDNRYIFYRKGSYVPLAGVNYAADTFTTPTIFFYNTDDLLLSDENVNQQAFTTVLFPNPLKGTQLKMMVKGLDVSQNTYTITDFLGRIVQSGKVQANGELLSFDLSANLTSGQYIVSILDGLNQAIITESFIVSH